MAAESEALEAPVLLRDDADGVATLTLNRPERRNALSRELMAALEAVLADIARDPRGTRGGARRNRSGFLLRPRSQGSACGPESRGSHGNLRSVHANDAGADAFAATGGRARSRRRHRRRLPACRQLCDLAVAAHGATFATPGVDIGLFCSTPMVALSRNVGRKQAMEMLVTGRPIDAETAARFGLVNRTVPLSELDAAVADLTRTIAAKPARVMAMGKGAFYRQAELELRAAYEYAGEVMIENMLWAPLRIRDLTEDDWLNGLWPSAAMLAPGFPGVFRAPIELFPLQDRAQAISCSEYCHTAAARRSSWTRRRML